MKLSDRIRTCRCRLLAVTGGLLLLASLNSSHRSPRPSSYSFGPPTLPRAGRRNTEKGPGGGGRGGATVQSYTEQNVMETDSAIQLTNPIAGYHYLGNFHKSVIT